MMASVKSLGKLASLMTNVSFPQRNGAAIICQRGTRYYRTFESFPSSIPSEHYEYHLSSSG